MADTSIINEAARERDESRNLWKRAWREAGLEGDPAIRTTTELAKGVTDAIQATCTALSEAHMTTIGEDFGRVPIDRLARDVAQAVKDGAHVGPVDCPAPTSQERETFQEMALRAQLTEEKVARAREQGQRERMWRDARRALDVLRASLGELPAPPNGPIPASVEYRAEHYRAAGRAHAALLIAYAALSWGDDE